MDGGVIPSAMTVRDRDISWTPNWETKELLMVKRSLYE